MAVDDTAGGARSSATKDDFIVVTVIAEVHQGNESFRTPSAASYLNPFLPGSNVRSDRGDSQPTYAHAHARNEVSAAGRSVLLLH